MTIELTGVLEIDQERGVIYFHCLGKTALRICRLPTPIPDPYRTNDEGDFTPLDITCMDVKTSWTARLEP